ncbi:MAG: asparagine synthase (glutamine-hydrolyzing) [Clostridia bacterium]|nr:asparagine synthase (glutamine-hydrolyzing) [Clostridia bacterium]
MHFGPSKRLGSGIFTGINELRAAHYMWVKNGEITIKRYWNVETKECNDTFEEAKDKVKELLIDSIKRQMVSDVPIATLLSGGLDSSLITAIVAKNKKDGLTTYSIDYEGNDKYFKKTDFTVSLDEHYIDVISKTFDTLHRYKTISQEDVVKYLKESLYARDYPGMTDIEASLLWFSKEIAKDYKVILSGECADEFFGGYPWFYREELNNRELFPWINNLEYRQNLLNENLQNEINLKEIVEEEYQNTINELPQEDRDKKDKRLFYINMTHFMQCLLDRKDRMTMYATLEARVPFADTKLVEYLWNLPFDYKYNNNTEKYLLREAFKGVIPEEVLNRKKNPYPKTHNPKFKEEVSKLLKKRLENHESKMYKIFNIDEINKLLDENDENDILPWYRSAYDKTTINSLFI